MTPLLLLIVISVMSFPGTEASSSSSTRKLVLFDIDGTLCDSSKLCFDSTNQVLLNNGFSPIPIAEYKEGSKYTTPRRFSWHVTKDPDAEIGIKLGEEFDRLYVALVSPTSVPLFDGIPSLLRGLKQSNPGLRIGALTNACSDYARAIYSCNEVISSTFDICYGVDDVPNAKPSGDGLLRICKVLGVSPADAVYIGDAPSDGQAAAAAGMTSIGVTWGSFPVKAMTPAFDVLVDTVADLEKLVMGSAALPVIE